MRCGIKGWSRRLYFADEVQRLLAQEYTCLAQVLLHKSSYESISPNIRL
jgi:hypothetical protein